MDDINLSKLSGAIDNEDTYCLNTSTASIANMLTQSALNINQDVDNTKYISTSEHPNPDTTDRSISIKEEAVKQ